MNKAYPTLEEILRGWPITKQEKGIDLVIRYKGANNIDRKKYKGKGRPKRTDYFIRYICKDITPF